MRMIEFGGFYINRDLIKLIYKKDIREDEAVFSAMENDSSHLGHFYLLVIEIGKNEITERFKTKSKREDRLHSIIYKCNIEHPKRVIIHPEIKIEESPRA